MSRLRRAADAAWRLARRHPFTASAVLVYLVVAAVTTTAWTHASEHAWYDAVAYGIPAFEAGRWWTPVTGAFVSEAPWQVPLVALLLAFGVGALEHQRGSWRAFGIFWAGQVGGVLASAALIDMLRLTGSSWAASLAATTDVGPSCGALTAGAVAIAGLRAPWRERGRLIAGGALLVLLIIEGNLADVEHAVSAGAVLLFGFGFARPRATVHEWRLVAFGAVTAVGVMQLVAAVLPTHGPLGDTTPGQAVWFDIATDVALIAAVAWALRGGRRWAWWVTVALACYNVAQAVFVLTFLDGHVERLHGAGIAAAASVLWAVALVILVFGRSAFAVPLLQRGRFLSVDAGDARTRLVAAIHRYGGGTFAWMATWPRMRVRFGPDLDDGSPAWALPIRRVGRVAIVLGDPIGPVSRWPEAIADFRSACEAQDIIPCCFSSSTAAAAAAAASAADWRSISVGVDERVALPGLQFTGKAWQPVRGAANRAEREGIGFRLTRLGDEPWASLAQVRAISEGWVGDKGLPEMGFTLGGVDEALDPEVRTALAVDADGSVHGVLSWLPVHGPQPDPAGEPVVVGWVLDIMRRRDGGFGPVIEFLIGESLLAFRDEGAAFASLSGAPLARSEEDAADDGVIGRVLTSASELLEPAYGFRSLHRFKQKFQPRGEPMRLLYTDEAGLPAIAAAIVRAYLPDASLADLARAGVSLRG